MIHADYTEFLKSEIRHRDQRIEQLEKQLVLRRREFSMDRLTQRHRDDLHEFIRALSILTREELDHLILEAVKHVKNQSLATDRDQSVI